VYAVLIWAKVVRSSVLGVTYTRNKKVFISFPLMLVHERVGDTQMPLATWY